MAGGKVALTEGTFTLAAAFQPVDGLYLQGMGGGATTITLAAGAVHTAMNTTLADSGTGTGDVTTTDTTLTDTRESWTPNEWIGYHVTCNDKRLTVTSNTETVLTGASWTGGDNPGGGAAWTLHLPAANCTIEGITFDGNSAGQTGGSSGFRGLIDFTYMPNVRFRDVRVTDGYDNGFYKAANTHTDEYTHIVDCEADNCGKAGILAQCSHALRISRTDIHDNTTDGALISDSGLTQNTRWHIDSGCHIYSNGGKGVNATGSSHGTVGGCEIYGNTSDGIDLTSCYDHIINVCKISYNGGYGIRQATAGGYHMIYGNRFSNNTLGDILAFNQTTSTLIGNFPAALNNEFARASWAAVADGGTVNHNMLTTPQYVIVTPSVSGEIVSVTAIGAATFTVAIKKISDGSSGTTQTLYWQAGWMPA